MTDECRDMPCAREGCPSGATKSQPYCCMSCRALDQAMNRTSRIAKHPSSNRSQTEFRNREWSLLLDVGEALDKWRLLVAENAQRYKPENADK